jgi:succinate-semialdehyde dehydrogenase/glutarate-semialdehyde dehydrogenase
MTAGPPAETRPWVGGRPRPGSGVTVVREPATGGVVAEVELAPVSLCLEAVDTAAEALRSWRRSPPRLRAEALRAAFELMTAERDEIAELVRRENGKAWREAVAEVTYAAEFLRWFSEEAVRIGGEIRRSPSGDKDIVVLPEPVGVAVLITPWNFPAAMATRKIAPALAAGCTCVLKPAPETPLTALHLAELLGRAGVPPGVVNVVLPEPPGPAVEAMLAHPAVRKLSFTGSTTVGAGLLRTAAERVLRTSMELGGNAPFIVLDDADLSVAVDAALAAKMRNGGASCVAANRFLVHGSLAEAFTDRLAGRMGALRLALGGERDADVGALVSGAEVDKVTSIVDDLVADGGRLRCGGAAPRHPGSFFEPTVVSGVAVDHPALAGEIFGPVAPVATFGDDAEAISAANAVDAGLIAYVMGDDRLRALAVASELEAGMVAINRGVISDPAAPFGGAKASGLGREGGSEGIEEYLERKYVGMDPLVP